MTAVIPSNVEQYQRVIFESTTREDAMVVYA